MVLILGSIQMCDTTAEAVAVALCAVESKVTDDHVQIRHAYRERTHGALVMGWRLTRGAPAVYDREVTSFDGAVVRGRWSPTGPATHPEIRRGVAFETEHGWVVTAATDNEDDDLADLVEQARTHVAVLVEGG